MKDPEKIVVVGATGLIGVQVVKILAGSGHDVVAASRESGVDVVTGAGLDDVLAGANALIDVTNSPTQEDGPAFDFFSQGSANLVAAAQRARVAHHVVLSIVGADRLVVSGYLRGKVVQESAAAASGLPFTIVRATQFHELAGPITTSLIHDDAVHVPQALIQPVDSSEVAGIVARCAAGSPVNGIIEFGGPEKMSFGDLARTVLAHQRRDLPVIVDPAATYFGIPIDHTTLVTGDGAELASTRLADWLAPSPTETDGPEPA